jgi:hypothetical protein
MFRSNFDPTKTRLEFRRKTACKADSHGAHSSDATQIFTPLSRPLPSVTPPTDTPLTPHVHRIPLTPVHPQEMAPLLFQIALTRRSSPHASHQFISTRLLQGHSRSCSLSPAAHRCDQAPSRSPPSRIQCSLSTSASSPLFVMSHQTDERMHTPLHIQSSVFFSAERSPSSRFWMDLPQRCWEGIPSLLAAHSAHQDSDQGTHWKEPVAPGLASTLTPNALRSAADQQAPSCPTESAQPWIS